jgi:hypothetical protein
LATEWSSSNVLFCFWILQLTFYWCIGRNLTFYLVLLACVHCIHNSLSAYLSILIVIWNMLHCWCLYLLPWNCIYPMLFSTIRKLVNVFLHFKIFFCLVMIVFLLVLQHARFWRILLIFCSMQ